MTARLAFWFLLGATLVVYAMLIFIFGPRLDAAAGGLPVFDLRVGGYTLEEAKAYLAALTPEGREIYLGPVRWIDTLFPGLLAATLYCALVVLLRPRLGGAARIVALVPIIPAAFDWLENAAVAAMLRAGADGVTAQMVETASRWTVLKWWTDIPVLLATLVLALLAAWRRWGPGRRVA
jgi:hypothetical protein